jgi:hypothetical protein
MTDEWDDRPLTPTELRDHRWWVERFGLDDPQRSPVHDLIPQDLASTGWGVLFAPDAGPEEREALRPLLEHRRKQAGPLFREYEYVPGMTKQDFLARQKAPPGPPEPRHVPYYLLIVGDPRSIPFRFQYELDVQYGVGRICFDQPEEYATYAQSVVRAETEPPARPKRLVLFATNHRGDEATARMERELVLPLAETLTAADFGWDIRQVAGPQATKAELCRLLGGTETPALLFTATHGMYFPPADPRHLSDLGALLCQDWPGPEAWDGPIPPGLWFAAGDVGDDADVQGLIAFLFGGFGGGALEYDSFSVEPPARRIASHPFVARLPQRLLSHPGGSALAVISQIDRGWTTSFSWSEPGQTRMFDKTLERLLSGHPVGSAMDYFNQRYAELSVELAAVWQDRDSLREITRSRVRRILTATNDARNFVVFGDPAVRLTFRDS